MASKKVVKKLFSRLLRGITLPLMVGNDICHIPRIRRIMGRSQDEAARFVRRVLTEEELSHPRMRRCILDILKLPSTPPSSTGTGTGQDGKSAGGYLDANFVWRSNGVSEADARKRESRAAVDFMAGRWAAKEAIIKAHPFRRLTFHDIMILPSARERDDPERVTQTTTTTANPDETSEEARDDDDPHHIEEVTGFVNRNNGSSVPIAIVKAPRGSKQPDSHVQLSISHDGDYASAVCFATLHDDHSRKLKEVAKQTWQEGYMGEEGWREHVEAERAKQQRKARRKEGKMQKKLEKKMFEGGYL